MLITLSEFKLLIHVLVESKLEQAKMGKPLSFIAYRWEDSKRRAVSLYKSFNTNSLRSGDGESGGYQTKGGLYVSDDIETWGGPYSKCLVKMNVKIQNPFILSKTKELEVSHDLLKKAKANGFDSVISVPKTAKFGTKQALLFYPNQQVKSMKIVSCDGFHGDDE